MVPGNGVVMKRLGLIGFALVLLASACGGGDFSQQDLDAAVADAVAAALATTSTSSTIASEATTTTTSAETTTSAPATTTTTAAEPTTTTAPADLDDSDPRSADAISGNAAPPLAKGDDGVLSVIGANYSVSGFGSSSVYVIIRNNTDELVKDVEVTITIRDSSGGLLASADTGDIYPYRVEPGGVAFGSAHISDFELPTDAQFEWQVASSNLGDSFDSRLNLVVTEHGNPGDTIIVIVENPTDTVVWLARVGAMCFTEDGEVLWFDDTSVDADSIDPGGTSPASVDLRDNDCPIYLIASKAFEQ
jgi:hypothetical protein